jgi:hypothetical protein
MLKQLYLELIQGMNAGASDTRKGLKCKIIRYMNIDPRGIDEEPRLEEEDSKTYHGFNHRTTGRLLTPRALSLEYERDPVEYMPVCILLHSNQNS